MKRKRDKLILSTFLCTKKGERCFTKWFKKKKEKGIANHITHKDLLSGKYPYETFTTQLQNDNMM